MKKTTFVFLISLVFLSLCLSYYQPSTAQNKSSSENSAQEPTTPFSQQTSKRNEVAQMVRDPKSGEAHLERRELLQTTQEPIVLFDLLGTEKLIVADMNQRSISVAGVREQEIRVNFDNNFEIAQELSFRLLDGQLYTAIRRESEGFVRFASDEFSWRGQISGENDWTGDVILTVKDRAVSGLIYSPGAVYEIVPQENFKHLLVQIDQSQFPSCGGAIPAEPEPEKRQENIPSLPDAQIAFDDGSQIDVMIVYTASVRSALGGTTQTQAFAQQAISTTNTVYQNSGIATRVRLVQTMEVSYADNGTARQGLDWVSSDATVAAARNTAKADMVAFLTENANDFCGIAWIMTNVGPSSESLAFSLTQRTCAIGGLTFPHELGHNQACDHNPENANPPSQLAYPYAFGHWNSSASFRTVMSYPNPCPSCARIPYFSNPSITHNGAPIGIANQRDNTRVINNTALTISLFRDSGGGGSCTPTPIAVGQSLNGTLTTTDCRYPTGSSWYSDAYTFNGTAGQQIAITMTSSAFDTWLGLQDPSGTELTNNNDGGGGTNSRIPATSGFYALPSTGTYKIQASSNPVNATGSYTVSLTQSGPANDNFVNAQTISGTSGTVAGTNVGATEESGEPNHVGNAGGKSVWYRWQAPSGGSVTMTTAGSNFDTLLGVYTGTSVGSLTTIVSNDDDTAAGVLTSKVIFDAVGGTIYRIAVDGYNGVSGNITLNWNGTSPVHATIGLYNPTSSTFFLRNTNTTGTANVTFPYGPAGSGWTPIVGDWDGNGTVTVGLYNPATSTFYLRNTNSAGGADLVFPYGPAGAGWKPIVGDWDGNGTETVGLHNPTTSTFFLRNANSAGAANLTFSYGPAGSGWTPVAGDWNGDGVDTIGFYIPSSSMFLLKNMNAAGAADLTFGYGPAGSGWKPIVADWNKDGLVTIGLCAPSSSTFYLRNSNTTGVADVVFGYGPAGAGWTPLAGNWDGQ